MKTAPLLDTYNRPILLLPWDLLCCTFAQGIVALSPGATQSLWLAKAILWPGGGTWQSLTLMCAPATFIRSEGLKGRAGAPCLAKCAVNVGGMNEQTNSSLQPLLGVQ